MLPGGRTGTVNFWYRTSPVPIVSAIVNPLPTTTRSAVRVGRHAHGVSGSECTAGRVPGAVAAGRRWCRGPAARLDAAVRVRRAVAIRVSRSHVALAAAQPGGRARRMGRAVSRHAGDDAARRGSGISRQAGVLQRGRAVDAPDPQHGAAGGVDRYHGRDDRQRHRRADHDRRRHFSPAATCAAAAAIAGARSAPRRSSSSRSRARCCCAHATMRHSISKRGA